MRIGALLVAGAIAAGCTTNPEGGDGQVPVDLGGGDGAGGGSCSPTCGGLTPKCNASHHCVGCLGDADCPIGDVCQIAGDTMATCVPGCSDDSRCGGGKCCTGHCVDPTSDPGNCGGCGMSCTAPHAGGTCSGSKCQAGACDPGWGDCNQSASDGCETNLQVDPANCTGCGMACALPNAIDACADGCYIAACQFGYDDCDVNTQTGCETSVLSDPNNCGGCAKLCNGLPNAQANCVSGNCVLGTCNPGFENCNGNPTDGCEANLLLDPKNCNGCGNTCPMNTPSCVNGTCGTLFLFSGVQTNLSPNQLGGWTQCFSEPYGMTGTPLATVMQKCSGAFLLLGCRQVGTQNLLVAAEAPRADVLFETGGGGNLQPLHDANGVSWYFDGSYSWGFVSLGDGAMRNSCDTQDQPNPDKRLCWHTGANTLNGGFRCGTNTFLNQDNTWERVVFTAN